MTTTNRKTDYVWALQFETAETWTPGQVHARRINDPKTLCGSEGYPGHSADTLDDVSCKRCRKFLVAREVIR